jgi:protein-S-isoprenylcysteine O-methyltransferase Ste14
MESETPFRVAVLVILLVTIVVALYHRWVAASEGDKITYDDEGYLFATVLRLTGAAVWLAVALYLIYPSAIAWASVPLPGWVRWLAALVGGLAPLLLVWTLGSLGKNLTDTVMVRERATLVTDGPYRWVRHPFYVSAAVALLAVAVLAANWFIAAAGVVTLGMLAVRTPREEAMLIERFGDDYRRYMAATGQFLPWLGRGAPVKE